MGDTCVVNVPSYMLLDAVTTVDQRVRTSDCRNIILLNCATTCVHARMGLMCTCIHVVSL
jgi:hypothetical protein